MKFHDKRLKFLWGRFYKTLKSGKLWRNFGLKGIKTLETTNGSYFIAVYFWQNWKGSRKTEIYFGKYTERYLQFGSNHKVSVIITRA